MRLTANPWSYTFELADGLVAEKSEMLDHGVNPPVELRRGCKPGTAKSQWFRVYTLRSVSVPQRRAHYVERLESGVADAYGI